MPKSYSNTDNSWPIDELVEDVIAVMAERLKAGSKLALITLIDRQGASPRKIGSQMLVDDNERYWGHVSGGCVEANLAHIAQDVIGNKTPRYVSLGDGGEFMDISLPCGSRIDLVIESIDANCAAVNCLLKAHDNRQLAVWARSGDDIVCRSDAIPDKAAHRENNGYYWRYTPPVQLIVNGRDAVTIALVTLAQTMGWKIILNGGRGHVQSPNKYDGVYLSQHTETVLKDHIPDAFTAIVSLRHDIEEDHKFLRHALPSDAFYVGVLGSRQHLEERRERLDAENISHERLSGPVGINIGAATPYEIAVSILAEIIQSS